MFLSKKIIEYQVILVHLALSTVICTTVTWDSILYTVHRDHRVYGYSFDRFSGKGSVVDRLKFEIKFYVTWSI